MRGWISKPNLNEKMNRYEIVIDIMNFPPSLPSPNLAQRVK